MATPRRGNQDFTPTPRPARATPEGAENRNVDLAVALAARQLEEGTASAQVIVHYLKLSTAAHQLELAKAQQEIILMEQKGRALQSQEAMEAMYRDAMNAMRSYSGQSDDD